MASWKGFGKGFLKVVGQGAKTVAPIIGLLAPAGSITALVATIVTHLTDRAEEIFTSAGSGKEKSAFVTVEVLKVLEATTGLNFDSPQGRALIQELINADVEVKNIAAQTSALYAEKLAAVQAYLASVKDPAQNDTDGAAA